MRLGNTFTRLRSIATPIDVYSPSFSPDGLILATGGPDRDVKIWETTTGKSLRVLTGHRDDVSAIAFSPDGKTLATGSHDHSLRLWDTDTWKPRAVIEDAFGARVFALAYDPTGTRLAAGGLGEEVTIWDATGQQLTSLPKSGTVWSLCFSPDGRLLAVGSGLQGTVHVWDVEQQKLVEEYLVGHVTFLPSHSCRAASLLIGTDGKLIRRDLANRAEPLGGLTRTIYEVRKSPSTSRRRAI